jgi:hypothetical protein
MRVSAGIASFVLLAIGVTLAAQELRHNSGQGVTPSFEGWFKNSDGSYSLLFGYYNRNFVESVDMRVGSDNRFDPGPADRGQPTHFGPRRSIGSFAVVVPADFGKATLTWTLIAHGQSNAVPGSLKPQWELSAMKELTTDNVPPLVRLGPSERQFRGPGGLTQAIALSGNPATLAVRIVEDGLKERDNPEAKNPHVEVPVQWTLFRGDGSAKFGNEKPAPDVRGDAVTTVTFAEPGTYVLAVQVGRATTGGCCWTNAFARVTVGERSR